ncbi:MAG: T9SS type B sorting domain-containing protein [Flavobacterium sp.]|nr:T9SS type B sorting domain-containing protein [Flavobacterium sp.]
MKKNIVLLLLFFFSANCFAQFSKTHYIPPVSNSNSQEPQGQFMYISCPSILPINFTINELGGNTIQGTVSRDNPYVLNIGSGFDTQFLINADDANVVKNNKGFIIEAEDQVYVTVRMTTTPQNYQAGGLVSKGLAALGTQFRIGGFTNTGIPSTNDNHFTFAGILATENNTTVNFSDVKTGVTLNNSADGDTPFSITLNRGESYVISVQGPNDANRDGLIGALISSDKPIAVNCGSVAGTNGDANNLDIGFDQIVSAERTGKEYIFIKGNGTDIMERPTIVANEDNTDVYLNGDTSVPFITLQAGDYVALNGSQYSANGNLYVSSSKNVFAYQGIGGSASQANQDVYFAPPLSCETPKKIDNIPLINEIGSNGAFSGTVAVVTEAGSTLSFIINGTAYTLTTLPAGVTAIGPTGVLGNALYETYTFQGLSGNISVYSTSQVYVSYFGSSGAATYGGFYSGFTFKPEIAFSKIDPTVDTNCIPNVKLSVNALTAFDDFQWYFNDVAIAGATGSSYIPDEIPTGKGPGFYYVKAGISACGTELISDKIPVSSCALDTDNDSVNNNVDLDIDNDGILNCTESYGNKDIDVAAAGIHSISSGDGNYINNFTLNTTETGIAAAAPFTGNADGSFVSETAAGIGNSVSEKITFTNPVSLSMEYVATAAATDLLSPNGNFILQVPVDKTITVLNPDDQLLIDTNYDGFFESGITQFSSFEIRFRLNNAVPLAAGTGTFKFFTNLVANFTYTHKNLSSDENNKATFKLTATCVPKDTDGDGIPNELDFDSDNDAIPDIVEAMGQNFAVVTFTDANGNGIEDTIEPGLGTLDTDGDGVPDYLDLDSDNDGVFDLSESGSNTADADLNGRIDGNAVGSNGYLDTLETTVDSSVINFTIRDTDGADIKDYLDLDSDNDTCFDVTEAGFIDADANGILGFGTPTTNASGVVTSTTGYTTPNPDYITPAPIAVTTPPQDQTECSTQTAIFTIATTPVDGYEWQVSTNGLSFNVITDNATYSGAATPSLQISNLTMAMDGYTYRVYLRKNGNTCGAYSAFAELNVLPIPNVPANITLVQCEDDLDGLSDFNLTEKESQISANAANETFTYFSTAAGAQTADPTVQISNPTVYNNSNGNTVWVRTQNTDQCFDTTQMNLIVSATQIPAGTSWSFAKCDDFVDTANDDHDGIATFDFSSVTADITAIIPSSTAYTITYYKNEADALAENDAAGNTLAITNISNYRNIGYPNQQSIWVRVDSSIDNACYGLGPYVTLTVEALPVPNLVTVPRACDDDPMDAVVNHSFDTSTIQSTILNGQTNITVAYFDENNNPLPSPLPNPFVTATQEITVRLTNNTTASPDGPCSDEIKIQFTVDSQPVANPVVIAPACDDLPNNNDGLFSFDTSTIESTLLGTQTGFTVKYFAADGSALSSPLPNPFTTATQDVTVIIENAVNTNCSASTVIHFVVYPLPEIEADHSDIICTGVVNESVTLYAGLVSGLGTDYSYEWSRNGVVIPGADFNTLTVNQDGVYTAKISNIMTGCFRIRTNTVVYSEIATITAIDIKDLLPNNVVTITPSGSGTYEFSIDNPYGPFQDSPIFENVSAGIHDVYVNDTNGCGIVSQQIAVVGAPLYFTPNGDGFHDTWKIKGVNAVYYKNSVVYIFDRYGKLLKEIPSGFDEGWDGTYNGSYLPADDYWYLLKLDDGRVARGHFALKR